MSSFSNWYNGEIDSEISKIKNGIYRVSWHECTPSQFILAISLVYTYYNIAHPFREGNGRTGKLFLSQISELSPYKINFREIDPTQWNLSSMRSSIKRSPQPLESVFWKTTKYRDSNKKIPYSALNLNERRMLTTLFNHTTKTANPHPFPIQKSSHLLKSPYFDR